MTCYDCRNRRAFARGSGLGWRSMFRVCYSHWRQRQARLHIAGRVALVAIVAALIVCGVCGFVAKVAWEVRGLAGQ